VEIKADLYAVEKW